MRNVIIFLILHISVTLEAQVVFDTTYGGMMYQSFGRNIEPANNGYLINAYLGTGYANTILYRLDYSADTLWTRRYGEDTVQYKTYEMIRCSDGGYLLCGDFQRASTSPNMDSYLMKIDSLGNVLWFNKYGITFEAGGGKDYANNVVELANGNILTIGEAKHSFTESGTLQNYSIFQGYVQLFNATGDSIRAISIVHFFEPSWQTWGHVFSCNDVATSGSKTCIVGHRSEYMLTQPNDDSYALILDANIDTVANVLFPIGTNMYSVDVTSSGNFLVYGKDLLTEIDTNGIVLWQQQFSFNPTRFTKVGARENGEIILLESSDGGDIAYTVDNSNLAGSQGNVILHTLNSNGVEICSDTISHWPASSKACVDFVLEGDSLITLTGGNGPLRVWAVQYYGRCHPFVGVTEDDAANSTLVYPNPCNDNVTVSGAFRGDVISILNSSGQLIYEKEILDSASVTLNFESFSSGIYLVKLTGADGGVRVVRLFRE